MQPKNVAFRKRTQINKANRTMFLWVASISVVFGIALVAIIFLTQMLLFNERVLQEKARTISTLNSNNKNIDALESKVRLLDTNLALNSVKAKPDDQAIQVILDALPSDANSLALGASLQDKLLAGVSGLTLISLQVDPVVGIESLDNSGSVVSAAPKSSEDNNISFRFSVSGSDIALRQVLQNLESSIRTVNVKSLKIESQGSIRVLSVDAEAFYEPARVVELKDKVVK